MVRTCSFVKVCLFLKRSVLYQSHNKSDHSPSSLHFINYRMIQKLCSKFKLQHVRDCCTCAVEHIV